MTETITPQSVNASWFVALKGEVTHATANFPHPELSGGGYSSYFSTRTGRIADVYDFPDWVKDRQQIFVALVPAAPTLIGYGTTPAAAIADFNAKMVAE